MKTLRIFVLLFCIIPIFLYSQNGVKIEEKPLVLPTYNIHPSNLNPMFFKGESYQGASKKIYPYPLMDNLSNKKITKEYTGLFLENEYIKLCVTPEIGGKLYWAEDKTNDYNFFYKNNVVKPANIGMLGAWLSGGIEWCVIHHHRASTYLPVDYTLEEYEDGSKTIWFGETEPRHRMKWIIGLTVHPGRSYMETTVKIFNRTPQTHSMLYWANVATHVNDDYQVFFPPSTDFGVDHHKVDFTHWPISYENYRGVDYTEGVDISMWKNHPDPTSVFCHNLKEDFMGGYDHGKKAGTVHVGNHHIVKGAKLWEWGPSELAQMWDKVLTDEDGPYAEIMVGGYSDNQPDYSWIRPYETKTIKQYWYPIKDIGGIKNANTDAAANLEVNGQKVFFGFHATGVFENAKVVLKAKDEVVFEENINIDPAKPFTKELNLSSAISEYDLKAMLLNRDGNEIISYQPKKKEFKDELPEVVTPPEAPESVESIEELYLIGLRLKQFYNPKLDAMPYFDEALKRDPENIAVNTFLGKQAIKNGEYDKAKRHLRTAINRIARMYTRPENCEAFFELGKVLKSEGKFFAAEDTLYRATWDYAYHTAAYHQLAEISCVKKDFETALHQINESLSTNMKNNKARNLKASILRVLNRAEEAKGLTDKVLEDDPLNYFAMYEQYFLLNNAANKEEAENLLKNINKTFRKDVQTYLELAVDYLNAGMLQEAKMVLNDYLAYNPENINPLVYYYLGFINNEAGNETSAKNFFAKGAGLPTDFCFPYRLETIDVLKMAMKYNENDAKAAYYLGNLLYDKQPEVAISHWGQAVKKDPGLAIAYRNLGWGYYRAKNDIPTAISQYEKAIENKNNDPIYYYELDKLYELANATPEKRLNMLEPNHNTVIKRNDALLREIIVLNLNGKYEKALEYLTNNHFHIREGDMRIRDINVNAHLLIGKEYFEEKKYEEAINHFELANTFPENQQVGRSLKDERVPQIWYFIGLANEALGINDEAEKCFKKSVEQELDGSVYKYYQGLSYLKLKEKEKAGELFKKLITEGQKKLNQGTKVDVYAKFGEAESENAILSKAHFKIGLGKAGLGDKKEAKAELEKAVELNVSNLWAKIELDNMK